MKHATPLCTQPRAFLTGLSGHPDFVLLMSALHGLPISVWRPRPSFLYINIGYNFMEIDRTPAPYSGVRISVCAEGGSAKYVAVFSANMALPMSGSCRRYRELGQSWCREREQ